MPPVQMTNEEVIAVLKERALRDGDAFRIKIFRKAAPTGIPEAVATLDQATVLMLAMPETWLPALCGGGPHYKLDLYHQSDLTTQACSPLNYQVQGAAKPIDPAVIRAADWQGPKVIVWANVGESKPQASYSIPPAPGNPVSPAPQTPVPPGTSVAGGVDLLAAERASLAARERELVEWRHKVEMERIKADNDAKLERLEAKITAMHQAKPAESPFAAIAAMLAPLVPLAQAIIQSGAETRRMVMDQQQKQVAETNRLITTMLEKKADDSPQMKLFSQMAEAMGTVNKMQTDAMSAFRESVLGPQEPAGLLAVKEIIKGVQAVGVGMAAKEKLNAKAAQAQHRPGPTQQRQLRAAPPPGHGPAPTTASPPASVVAAPAPAQQPVQNGAAHTIPPAGAVVASIPLQQPVAFHGPPSVAPVEADEQYEDEGDDADDLADEVESTIGGIEQLIKGRSTYPVVTAALNELLSDPEAVQYVQETYESPVGLFQAKLGEWASEPTNAAYMQGLMEHLNAPEMDGEEGEEAV